MSLIKKKSPKKSNRILQQNEFRLLLNSQAIEEFSWLKTQLQKKEAEAHPYLTHEDAITLSADKQQFFRNSLGGLIEVASDEWTCDKGHLEDHGEHTAGGEWPLCKLCNTPNRYEFCIVNRENGKRLNVGSRCIKYFGITDTKTLSRMIRGAKKIARIHEIDLEIPKVENLITRWDRHLDSYPILIPHIYDQKFRELGKQCRSCFEEYVDSKSKPVVGALTATVQKLKQFCEERERLVEQMDEYSTTHENDQFVATRDIVQWLQRLGNDKSRLTFKWLMEDGGYITARSALRIEESGFMQSIVPNLNDHLRDVGLQVQSVDNSRHGYVLITIEKPVIKLIISHRNLLLTAVGAMFENQQGIDRSEVSKYCAISDPESREIVRAKFAKGLSKIGYSELSLSGDFESTRDEFDEWALIEHSSQRIILVEKLSRILDEHIAGMTQEEFVRKYVSQVRSYSRDDFQERYSDRIRNR